MVDVAVLVFPELLVTAYAIVYVPAAFVSSSLNPPVSVIVIFLLISPSV